MTNKINTPNKNGLQNPTVVSLFSGAGGMDLGLEKAGLNIIWANDNDKDSVETYKLNFKYTQAICEDVSMIKSDDIPDADLIVGGFPCQGFSVANKFRKVDDSRNILYLEMLRIITDKQPKWFIAENVRGILNIGGGAVIQKIVDDFEKAGYSVKYQLVNMADHGVPQMRKRVIIMGTRKDLMPDYELSYPEVSHSQVENDKLKKWVSVNEAFTRLASLGNIPDLDVGSKYKVSVRNFTGHRITDGNKPSPTILARGNGKGGVNATPHPNGLRRMTVRESAWVQTFPHDFIFFGSVNSQYRQIGNAVPVIYAEKLGTMLTKVYEKYKQNKLKK